jgi:hypothetical protein
MTQPKNNDLGFDFAINPPVVTLFTISHSDGNMIVE